AAAHPRIILGGAEAGVEVERLAQSDVDAAKAGSDGRRDGSLEGDLVAADRIENLVGERSAVLIHDVASGLLNLPLDGHTARVDDASGCFGHFRADAVSGNERYTMSRHASTFSRSGV